MPSTICLLTRCNTDKQPINDDTNRSEKIALHLFNFCSLFFFYISGIFNSDLIHTTQEHIGMVKVMDLFT